MAVDAETQFHVLAVDDSIIDRKLIERLLKSSSYQVTTVDSGSKALEVLGLSEDEQSSESSSPASSEQNEIDVNLVITDYCMPGMNGYDLLMKIKGSSCLKDIPVVIMSSENVPSRINRCLEGGAEEFILKPVKLSDMKRLRPHILKGKSKEHNNSHCERGHKSEEQQQQEEEQQQEENNSPISCNSSNSSNDDNINNNNDGSSKKRKAVDEVLSSERTRPRLSSSSLTVVLNGENQMTTETR